MSHYYRGHKIFLANGIYIYKKTRQPVADNPNIKCGYCNLENTLDGHDGCLMDLPGVINACCGHGEEEMAYVMFSNKNIISGKMAADLCSEKKGNRGIQDEHRRYSKGCGSVMFKIEPFEISVTLLGPQPVITIPGVMRL